MAGYNVCMFDATKTKKNTNNFDVLHSQLSPEQLENMERKVPIRFENMRKPTEIYPVVEEEILPKKLEKIKIPEKIEKKLEVKSAESSLHPAKEKMTMEENDRISSARKEYLVHLHNYLKSVRSRRELFTKTISGFGIDKQMPQLTESKELLDAEGIYFSAINEANKGFLEGFHNIEIVVAEQEKENNIVFSRLSDAFSPREKNIHRKAMQSWDGFSEEKNKLAEALLNENNVKFQKSPKAPSYTGFRAGKNIDEETKDMKVFAKVEEMSKEVLEKVQEQKVTENSRTMQFDYEGKPVEILLTRENGANDETLRVFFQNKEIAKGLLTKSGLQVRLHPAFKAGFLFAKTDSQKAFEKILPNLKSLKANI